MSQINRRRFLEVALGGASGALLYACSRPLPDPPVTPTSLSPTEDPGTARIRGRIVQNENRADRNVRYFRPFVPPAPEEWRLTVGGLIGKQLSLSFADVQQLPYLDQISRMKCVECWSFKSQWGGFTLASLMEQVQPGLDAQYVRLTCGDEYWEVLPVDQLLRDRVLFAYRMDHELLADEYGSPLRLVVPWKYGYKGAKCIVSVDFTAEDAPGYWSTVGPYTVSGDIEAGFDVPQETGERVSITEPGRELTH